MYVSGNLLHHALLTMHGVDDFFFVPLTGHSCAVKLLKICGLITCLLLQINQLLGHYLADLPV